MNGKRDIRHWDTFFRERQRAERMTRLSHGESTDRGRAFCASSAVENRHRQADD